MKKLIPISVLSVSLLSMLAAISAFGEGRRSAYFVHVRCDETRDLNSHPIRLEAQFDLTGLEDFDSGELKRLSLGSFVNGKNGSVGPDWGKQINYFIPPANNRMRVEVSNSKGKITRLDYYGLIDAFQHKPGSLRP